LINIDEILINLSPHNLNLNTRFNSIGSMAVEMKDSITITFVYRC